MGAEKRWTLQDWRERILGTNPMENVDTTKLPSNFKKKVRTWIELKETMKNFAMVTFRQSL